MTTIRTALVIGAGIAGPVAAMALRKAGIQPTVSTPGQRHTAPPVRGHVR